jgi:hypothetical protein
MTANLSREPLTGLLITALGSAGAAVGDARKPETGVGWIGEPNAPGNEYTPYLVLTPLAAVTSDGPFDSPQADWRLPYQIQAFGVSRQQCEWMADQARSLLGAQRGQVLALGSASYKTQQVRTESIGAVQRQDSTDPATFTQADVVSVWLTKEP